MYIAKAIGNNAATILNEMRSNLDCKEMDAFKSSKKEMNHTGLMRGSEV
jgi:hypothetical protein